MTRRLILLLLAWSSVLHAQELTDLKGDCLGQIPPGDTPVVFARGIVSTDDLEHSAAMFSPDGQEVFWHVNRPPGPNNKDWMSFTNTMQRIGDRWTVPALSQMKHPIYSIDGQRLYFIGEPDGRDYYADKQDDGWGQWHRIDLMDRVPEVGMVYTTSVTRDGTLYFTGTREGLGTMNDYAIYRAECVGGEYAEPELLPPSINKAPFINWTPYVAPDESYLIFSTNRNVTGHDGGDLYLCFRQPDGSWTEPVSLGAAINSPQQERLPHVTPDGKYLLFTRWTPDHDQDVFWVNSRIIDEIERATVPDPNGPVQGSAP